MLCSHFRQRCTFLREILYSLFLNGEFLTAVETDKKNKGCGIPRAIEPRPYFFPPSSSSAPGIFSFLSLSLSCQLHNFPLYFLPLPPNKKGSLGKKAGFFFFRAVSCVCGGGGSGKKPAFSEQFSRKISAASVRANIFGRGLHPPAEMATLYWGQRC